MKKEISTENAPKAIGPYSQGIIFNNLIFTSGQIPINPLNNEIKSDIESQANQVFNNIKNILEKANSSMNNVIKVTIFLKDLKDFDKVNKIYCNFFNQPYPARSCVEVSKLPKDVLIEAEAIAYK